VSGSDGGGKTALNGVQFAVQRAANGIDDWNLALDVYDDTRQGASNADAGVEDIRTMVSRGDLGMIGPCPSSIARAEIPIAAEVHLTISIYPVEVSARARDPMWAWSAERTCRGFASSGSRASALTAKGEGTDVSNHKLLAARDYERIRSVVDPALVLDWPQSSETGSGCTEDSDGG